VKAHAKINLTLSVLGKRPDGFHQVETVLQTLSLADRLEIGPQESGLAFSCNCPELDGADNLCARAAARLAALRQAQGDSEQRRGAARHTVGAWFSLRKEIPAGAGLGGGSSDAAAALRGLNVLWEFNHPPEDLHLVAVELGSDVPFFLYGGTALAFGRGEQVTPLKTHPDLWLVLAKPPASLSTTEVYAAFDEEALPESEETPTAAMIDAVAGGEPAAIAACLHNDLEAAALRVYPEVGEVKEAMLAAGCLGAAMSGSGSAVFGIAADRAAAQQAAKELRKRWEWVHTARTVSADECQRMERR
jgi:4-diphosphocytidyl-2-C-methyl-D-erythritol kinase